VSERKLPPFADPNDLPAVLREIADERMVVVERVRREFAGPRFDHARTSDVMEAQAIALRGLADRLSAEAPNV
jgi:hypothetical protein